MHAIVEQLDKILPYGIQGQVSRIVGLTASVAGLPVPLGSLCRIEREHGPPVDAELIGFKDDESILLAYGSLEGVKRGDAVHLLQSSPAVRVGERLLGRVIDGRGNFIDGLPPASLPNHVNLHSESTAPLTRPRIDTPLGVGVRAIDGFLTCGMGQRLGIFAGSGVGKSTLLGQMARSSSADVNVVVLVGERGREVREFLERDLGPEGLARSVVVVATSNEPALLRLRSAFLGAAVAEYFRDSGKDVLLMMDSVTRFALAQREIGLAAGEPPATRGYPPSVFSLLPRLLERSGRTDRGSITGFYTVLVEADDDNEPISDTVRSILDGHIMLSRRLAGESHWPAIDVMSSISRSMTDVVTPEHREAAQNIKRLLAAYQRSEDLISIGAYQAGTDRNVDMAMTLREPILKFLRQGADERSDLSQSVTGLMMLNKMREEISGSTGKAEVGGQTIQTQPQ